MTALWIVFGANSSSTHAANGGINVLKTHVRHRQGTHKWEWYLGPPKNRKSLRGIAATDSVMKLLAYMKVGIADSAFVFPGDCHGFIDPNDFEALIWRPIVERAGMLVPRFTICGISSRAWRSLASGSNYGTSGNVRNRKGALDKAIGSQMGVDSSDSERWVYDPKTSRVSQSSEGRNLPQYPSRRDEFARKRLG